MTQLKDYQNKYENFSFERTDGILQVTMHTNGKDLVWGMKPDDELGHAFEDIAGDMDNEVIILTGTGDTFIHEEDLGADFDQLPAEMWGSYILPYVIRLIHNHLDIDAPMIAAINGPATIHAEMGLLCDIVLASDTACFADQPHFPNGLVPGDGVQVIWPMLIGMNRARYLMYTGQVLTAEEALNLGLVSEVMPKDDLLPRAWEIARQIMEKPRLTRRLTRRAFGAVIKQQLNNVLPYGAALEGLAAANYWPREFTPAKIPGRD